MARLAPSIKLVGAVVVLLLGGSSPALAGPALVTNRYALAGERSELALNGSTTLVGGYESETTNVVRAFTPGQAPKTIARATIKPQSGEFSDSMYFVASPSRLVMLDQGRSFTYKGSRRLISPARVMCPTVSISGSVDALPPYYSAMSKCAR